jgi:hypothetical protein
MFKFSMLDQRELSPMLLFSTMLLVVSAFNYGFSDQAFASCQAMEPFIRQFGVYDKTTKTWIVEPLFTSLYNSLKAGAQIIGICSLLESRDDFAHTRLQECLPGAISAIDMDDKCVYLQ